jgi:hypothetical protein
MYCTPNRLQISETVSATCITSSVLSMTQGPAINVSGLPSPTTTEFPTFAKWSVLLMG